MGLQLDTLPRKGLTAPKTAKAEEVGGCPVCKRLIFSDQPTVRAPRPLLGAVHEWCGGAL